MLKPANPFAPFLNSEIMARTFQTRLFNKADDQWQVSSCEIQHPRYKTYRSKENRNRATLSLVYHLHGRALGVGNKEGETRIYFARVFFG